MSEETETGGRRRHPYRSLAGLPAMTLAGATAVGVLVWRVERFSPALCVAAFAAPSYIVMSLFAAGQVLRLPWRLRLWWLALSVAGLGVLAVAWWTLRPDPSVLYRGRPVAARASPADLWAAHEVAKCERVWADMGAGQRASFGSREQFVSVCRTSLFVAACNDGYVQVGKGPEDFCTGRGGVKTWRKSPDA